MKKSNTKRKEQDREYSRYLAKRKKQDREYYRYLAKHPVLLAREVSRKAKFLWWITGIRHPEQIRRTTGTVFFFWLRRLMGRTQEHRSRCHAKNQPPKTVGE